MIADRINCFGGFVYLSGGSPFKILFQVFNMIEKKILNRQINFKQINEISFKERFYVK